ncbi:carbonic anhydrase [Paenibacillus oenotherae]|uniref:carbonic anhydrase n=1 Tax=Paenibacillus oenotherae TaxID=1435645 RepID=A0ABS7DB38_9BACL|nr:carbonic anhydrase [Paenibacillus oenotherae]MBW7477106.1 carbonic anhydrase [Paenibacillus oenotherae]
MIDEIMAFNEKFVQEKQYESYVTDKYPDKRIAILTCMDTRLVELLPKALNLKNGDAKIIKNAGAILTQPFGSAMRSILIAIYEMDVQEILVIGHHGCGMTNHSPDNLVQKFMQKGISEEVLMTLENSGIRMNRFLKGFETAEEGVMHSVSMIRRHPLMPTDIPVHGFVMDPTTGRLELIHQGYNENDMRHERIKHYKSIPFD